MIKKWQKDFLWHHKLLIKLKLVNLPFCLHNLMKRIYKQKMLKMMATLQLRFKLKNHKLTHLTLVQEIKEAMVFLMVLHRLRRLLRWVQLIILEVWEVIVDKKLKTLVKGTKVRGKQTMVKVHQDQMFRIITFHTRELMKELNIVKSSHSAWTIQEIISFYLLNLLNKLDQLERRLQSIKLLAIYFHE